MRLSLTTAARGPRRGGFRISELAPAVAHPSGPARSMVICPKNRSGNVNGSIRRERSLIGIFVTQCSALASARGHQTQQLGRPWLVDIALPGVTPPSKGIRRQRAREHCPVGARLACPWTDSWTHPQQRSHKCPRDKWITKP